MIDPLRKKKKKKFTTIAAKYLHCVNNKIYTEPLSRFTFKPRKILVDLVQQPDTDTSSSSCNTVRTHPSISLLLSRAHRNFFRYSYYCFHRSRSNIHRNDH